MNFCQTLQVRREAFTDRLWPTFPSRGDVFLEPLTVCVLAFVRCTSQAPEVSCTAQQLWGFRKINLPLSLIGILLFSLHNLLFNQQPITSTWKLLYVTVVMEVYLYPSNKASSNLEGNATFQQGILLGLLQGRRQGGDSKWHPCTRCQTWSLTALLTSQVLRSPSWSMHLLTYYESGAVLSPRNTMMKERDL